MKKLAPVDFKAIAAKGCFVYCYLRANDGKIAKAGTPYYIGLASLATRPFAKHSVPIPADKSLVRVMRFGLSWEQACQWEKTYIAHFGRIDKGEGVLRNMTDGGEGALGVIVDPAVAKARAEKIKGQKRSEKSRQKMRDAAKGKTLTEEHKAKIGAAATGKKMAPALREQLMRISSEREWTDQMIAQRSLTRIIKTAQRNNLCPLLYGTAPAINRKQWVLRVMATDGPTRADSQSKAVAQRLRNNAARVGMTEAEYLDLSPSARRRALAEVKSQNLAA